MNLRLLGAIAVVFACGGFGALLARNYKRQEQMLFQLQRAISYISNELAYKSPYLPELCLEAANLANGMIKEIFSKLAEHLLDGNCPDASIAMERTIAQTQELTPQIRRLLILLGQCLGRFGLDGQVKELNDVLAECRIILDDMRQNRKVRIQNYQTLGLCAGAALAILLV